MQSYNLTSLGSLNGISSNANGINNFTQVVGDSGYGPYRLANYHAFLWHTGHMVDLGALESQACEALAINDRGQAVGRFAYSAEPQPHAFLYKNGQMTDLTSILSPVMSWASDINEKGQIVGSAVFAPNTNSEGQHAFLYDSESGSLTKLGTLPGRDFSVATAVNNNGQVVGNSRHANTADSHPFLYENDKMIDPTPNSPGVAYDINNGGQVLGYSLPQGMFIFANGQLRYPGITPVRGPNTTGITHLRGLSLNDVGQVVGRGKRGSEDFAMIYSEQDGVIDLNTLIPSNSGWYLDWAADINDHGQIVGAGHYEGGFARAFMLTPTTETVPPWDETLVEILFGVTKDGGGKILAGGRPRPVDPWPGLREILSPIVLEMVVGATVFSAAFFIENPELRREMERLAGQLFGEAIKNSLR